MQWYTFLSLLLLVALPAQSVKVTRRDDAELSEHPIKRVIRLMQELSTKSDAEGKEELKTYNRFEAWCDKTKEQLNEAIGEENEVIVSKKGQIKSKKLEREDIMDEIEVVQADLGRLKVAASEAAKDRKAHLDEYAQAIQDLNVTISSIGDALTSLKATQKNQPVNASTKSTTSLLQELSTLPLMLVRLSDEEQALLLDANTTASPLSGSAPKAKTYDFKTGKVVDLLKKLKDDFDDQLHKAQIVEMTDTTDFQLANNTIYENIKVTSEALDNKVKAKTALETVLTKLNSDLDGTKNDLAADTTTLQKTTANCHVRADEFKERTYMRKREREAIAYGITILEKAAGVRSSAPKSFLQLQSHRARSRVRHRARFVQANDKKVHGLQMLRRQAMHLGSSDLERLAMQLEARLTDDGVGKQVNLMLDQKIWALQDQQLQEDEKRHWCDLEINKTATDKDAKGKKMKVLKDEITKGEADIAELVETVEAAKSKITELDKSMYERKMEREETKGENSITIKDSQKAQKALADAIAVLAKYYKDASDAAEAASLVQAPLKTEAAPDVWTQKSYTGTSQGGKDPGTAIIQVLEQAQADFAKMEEDTKAADTTDEKDFDEDSAGLKKEKAVKETEADLKNQERMRIRDKVDGWKEDLKMADRKKALLTKSLEDLLVDCNATEYQARKAARAEEISGLNTTQAVLKDAFDHSDVNVSNSSNSTR
eukprot:TRINITY_DN2137_c0_g1_i2.p1 TRINITY_DN2137_c0_g1~~TRINITY_DN2137_c0_g1_i2.p1  ORF type:complete len:715 (-),score=221.61 TRINITY_DN2137_c0_g1_i2:188-2332(-)